MAELKSRFDTDKTHDCLFCHIPKEKIIAENELAYAIRDRFPVTLLHTLIIPKRHVIDYFSLEKEELYACDALIKAVRSAILKADPAVSAFNIGMNAGEDAGQSIFHCHIHLIPRRKNDVANPKGGIRHTIPGKGYY